MLEPNQRAKLASILTSYIEGPYPFFPFCRCEAKKGRSCSGGPSTRQRRLAAAGSLWDDPRRTPLPSASSLQSKAGIVMAQWGLPLHSTRRRSARNQPSLPRRENDGRDPTRNIEARLPNPPCLNNACGCQHSAQLNSGLAGTADLNNSGPCRGERRCSEVSQMTGDRRTLYDEYSAPRPRPVPHPDCASETRQTQSSLPLRGGGAKGPASGVPA